MSKLISFPKDENLPKEVVNRLNSLPAINVYRMIANAPSTLIPWTDMVKGLYDSKVAIRYREIAILRQASRAQSNYELHQHTFIARANGLTGNEINTICGYEKSADLSDKEMLVCKMADEIELNAGLTPTTLKLLQQYFDTQELSELIILTSFYSCVARVLNSTGVEIENSNPLKNSKSPN
jgi:alkylhydroperoxidase family enzyme